MQDTKARIKRQISCLFSLYSLPDTVPFYRNNWGHIQCADILFSGNCASILMFYLSNFFFEKIYLQNKAVVMNELIFILTVQFVFMLYNLM